MTSKERTAQQIFAKNVRTKLSCKVKATVKTSLEEDTLIVKIYCVNGIVFITKRENLSLAIKQGVTSEICALAMLQRYTNYIRNLFFL